MTRRNDRQLLTTAGQPVRNRDRWTVTGIARRRRDWSCPIIADTAPSRLAREYVREHVRLGYAATEHGHQGDTVDVAYELVTRATTHRGLYVGATRGRDANHLLVVTDTADPTEARDVLEHVLANDRADVPAVAQRRHLAGQIPPPARPGHGQRSPSGSTRSAAASSNGATSVVGRLDRVRGRTGTKPDSTSPRSNPTSTPPRRHGRPTPPRSPTSANTSTTPSTPPNGTPQPTPARAGIGRRHATRRRLDDAQDRIGDAEAAIAQIETAGTPSRAGSASSLPRLATSARPPASTARSPYLDHLDRQQLQGDQNLLDALDTWHTWATGQPVAPHDLAAATATIADAARHARPWATRP